MSIQLNHGFLTFPSSFQSNQPILPLTAPDLRQVIEVVNIEHAKSYIQHNLGLHQILSAVMV